MNKDKKKTFIYRRFSSSDGIYHCKCKEFILQHVYIITEVKDIVSFSKLFNLKHFMLQAEIQGKP